MIPPLHALAYLAPEALDELREDLLALALFDPSLTLRPEQMIPRDRSWRSFGFLTGRGWGKTHAIAYEVNRRVAAGEARSIALMGPTMDRVGEVQVPALIATAPIECPCEDYHGAVRWQNGTVAEACTSEVERPSSGSNYDTAWLTELVRWNPNTRVAAFNDITTATRIGSAQYLWDTTSSGKNDVINSLLAQHDAAPSTHRLVRGTMFDNPLLSRQYLVDEVRKYQRGTRAYDEEVLGQVFTEAAGALWRQDWIDQHRVPARPIDPTVVVLGLDPALSGERQADEVGLAKVYRDANGHLYLEDLSERMSPEDYAATVVRECQRDASGVVVERNHVGQHARDLIRVHARLAGMRIELLPEKRPFPARRPGTIFVREVVSHTKKETRAAPIAALARAGKLHHIGELPRLEHEQTTWTPGEKRSPNRIDAAVFAAGELGDVSASRPDAAKDVHAARVAQKRVKAIGRKKGRLGL